MDASKAKVKIAKYSATSMARKAILDAKHRRLTIKLIRAHSTLAKLHQLVQQELGSEALDAIYSSPFKEVVNIGSYPDDPHYDSLVEELTLSRLNDEDLGHSLSKIRRTAKKTMKSWQEVEIAQYKLWDLQEKAHSLHKLLRRKKSAIWIFFKLYQGNCGCL